MIEYSDEGIQELYSGYVQEMKDLVRECTLLGIKEVSPYGRDLRRLFLLAKAEMERRGLL